jgi:hypothetical protein
MTSKKNRLSEEVKSGIIYLNIGLITIISLTGFIYLFSIGSSSQMGYSFTLKEQENNQLKNQNEILKLQVLKASSFSEINKSSNTITRMEKATPEFYETRLDRLSKK